MDTKSSADATLELIKQRITAGQRTYLHDMYPQYFFRVYGLPYMETGAVFDQRVREKFDLDTDENGVVYIKGLKHA